MERTPFAGLTELAAGESLSVDGFSFQSVNPPRTDYLLKLGATLHHHNAASALAPPASAASGVVNAGTGGLPAGRDLYFTYTYLDDRGGETIQAPAIHIVTPGSIPAPTSGPSGAVDYSAGDLTTGTYYYALTYTDAGGNETTRGPYSSFVREPGSTTARINFVALNASMPAGAVGWRLYKSSSAIGQFKFVGSGTSLDATFVDDGNVCADCVGVPPTTNRTGSNSNVTLTFPAFPSGVSGFRLYGSDTGAFLNPSYLGEHHTTDSPLSVSSFNPGTGAPPIIPTAVGGAPKINPATDINDWYWKPPVASAGALPASGNTRGDVRMAFNNLGLYAWMGSAWASGVGGGGGGGGGGTTPGAWTNLTPATDWAVVSSGDFFPADGITYSGNAQYIVQGTVVRLRGAVKRATTTHYSRPSVFATLPGALGPAQKTKITFLFYDASNFRPVWVWGFAEVVSGITQLSWYQVVDGAMAISFGSTDDVVILDGIVWDNTP